MDADIYFQNTYVETTENFYQYYENKRVDKEI